MSRVGVVAGVIHTTPERVKSLHYWLAKGETKVRTAAIIGVSEGTVTAWVRQLRLMSHEDYFSQMLRLFNDKSINVIGVDRRALL